MSFDANRGQIFNFEVVSGHIGNFGDIPGD